MRKIHDVRKKPPRLSFLPKPEKPENLAVTEELLDPRLCPTCGKPRWAMTGAERQKRFREKSVTKESASHLDAIATKHAEALKRLARK